jgi:hypothetical protein
VRTGAKKKSLSPTSPTKRASSGVKAHKASRLTKGGNLPVLRKDKRTTKNRRILVLRETKNRKLVRTTVTVPRSRMETRSLKSANTLTPEHSTDILVSPSLSPSLPQEAAASPGPTTAAVRKFEPELQMAPQRPH